MIKKISLLLLVTFITSFSFSQSGFKLPNSKKEKIRFQLVGNLILIPLEMNGVELSFVLDSGVSKTILFNLTNIDSLQVNNAEIRFLRGLGGGEPVKAIKSKNNFLKVGKAININQDVYVVFDTALSFTPRLGVPVHGIIGYDLLKDFVVEINYASQYLILHEPKTYKYKSSRRWETLDLSFYNAKPYLNAEIKIDSSFIPVSLLIDTGSSDALWLFDNEEKGLKTPETRFFSDFLGKGLSGNIYGKRTKIKAFRIKSFDLEDVNTAFPDSVAISMARKNTERSGSVSGAILKRFNLILDYSRKKMALKRNKNFRAPFSYNKAGIVLEQSGYIFVREREISSNPNFNESSESTVYFESFTNYKLSLKPAYTIVDIRKDSPADRAGLLEGDIILRINGKETHKLELQEVISFFKSKTGKMINLKIDRAGKEIYLGFRLEDVFKQKELQ